VSTNFVLLWLILEVGIAQRAVYELAKPLGGKVVEDLLKSFSGVPTMVATYH